MIKRNPYGRFQSSFTANERAVLVGISVPQLAYAMIPKHKALETHRTQPQNGRVTDRRIIPYHQTLTLAPCLANLQRHC